MAKLADHEIIPAVLAKIEHCDAIAKDFVAVWSLEEIHRSYRCAGLTIPAGIPSHQWRQQRFAKAADRLRDFATVELLCEGQKEPAMTDTNHEEEWSALIAFLGEHAEPEVTANDFMAMGCFMGRSLVRTFKHIDTRRYLNIEVETLTPYIYTGAGYVPVPPADALKHALS